MGATVTSMLVVTSTERADAHNRFFDRGKARRSVHNAQTASPQNRLGKSLVGGETRPWNIDLRSVSSFARSRTLSRSPRVSVLSRRSRRASARRFPVRRNRSTSRFTARTHLRHAILRAPASHCRNRLGNKLLTRSLLIQVYAVARQIPRVDILPILLLDRDIYDGSKTVFPTNLHREEKP